jgi:hypothetical protein
MIDQHRIEYINTCKEAFAQAMENNKILIHYVRDWRGNRIGVLTAAILENDERPSYGWAMCHPKKDHFNKYIGLSKALERMVLGSPTNEDGTLILPPLVLETMPEFEKRVVRYFKLEEPEEDHGTMVLETRPN